MSLPQQLTLYLGAMFCACMVCHGELARLKPRPRHLTEFYLWIAAGGAVGGLFVGIVAPLVFSAYYEWQIGVAVSGILAVGLLVLPRQKKNEGMVSPPPSRPKPSLKFSIWRWGLMTFAAAVALLYLAFWALVYHAPLDYGRNFFGVVSVNKIPVPA